ncbi:ABC transporter permease [Micromonospora tulbaghiae]|uniref:ABC transporter permease n=1 Tax=Micromonospora tulbaghiae TaxID=479978 RepID=A0AAW4JVC8_9ACTN|nr:ABC transporter permease [Micromonospora tulbaghiae]MBO4143743.1 ABC transporter permease [Micromonospora tulbaghiae]MDX5459632.1 ABC transporter permease [Micromonospora tulbaghiae]SCF17629.1 monosaccharide ABC transporter membrane protein, CUT2 family [Micromonospora tulbaghiae]
MTDTRVPPPEPAVTGPAAGTAGLRGATAHWLRRPRSRRELADRLFAVQSLFALLAVFVVAILASPRRDGEILFLTAGNLGNIVRAVSEIGIIAIGMTFVVLLGGIDLSVGAILGLSAVGTATLMVDSGLGILPAVAAVLAIGALFGALQGYAVARLGIQSFIVTLAGLQVARGIARIWSGGLGIPIAYGDGPQEAPPAFELLNGSINGVLPVPAVLFVLLGVAAVVVLRTTAFARHVYAIGGNEKAARLSGVPVTRVKVAVFAVAGLLAAVAGVVHAGQLNQGSPNDGAGYELDAIAAVVIGGTSLAGGSGSMGGTLAGALLLGILNNILALNNIDANVQLLIKGLVIVLAAALQKLRRGLA